MTPLTFLQCVSFRLEGKIGPFESTKLKVRFTPTIPGEARLKFYIKFSNSTIKPVRYKIYKIFFLNDANNEQQWQFLSMQCRENPYK